MKYKILCAAAILMISFFIIDSRIFFDSNSRRLNCSSLFSQEFKSAQSGNAGTLKTSAPAADFASSITITGVIIVIWIALALYLIYIDRKVTRLEKKLNE